MMILPDGKVTGWGFDRDTHAITSIDFEDRITEEVKTVIIGSGLHGEGFLDNDAAALVKELEAKGISIHLLPTIQAVNMFNASPKKGLLTFLHVRN
ncbi:MAG: Mth938-like domain-containing protein [Rhodospirillales bacterium]|nr:Mth938-like domain-containing protein [Rhodospirillales bacterium]